MEHDEEIMRAADYLIDVGPDAGRLGGEIVYEGSVPTDISHSCFGKRAKLESSFLTSHFPNSYTVRYLNHEDEIPVPASHRPWNRKIIIKGARMNNLKGR